MGQKYNDITRQTERADERQQLRPFLRQYLEGRGIDTTKNFRCLSSEHEDRNPSMGYDPTHNRVWCRGCGVRYDIFDLIAAEMGRPAADRAVFEEVRRRYGAASSFSPTAASEQIGSSSGGQPMGWNDEIRAETPPHEPPTDYTEYFRLCQGCLNMTDYPQRRGLTVEICERFGLGFDPAWHHPKATVTTPRLIIPTSRSSYTARDVRETMPDYQKSYKIQKVGGACLYLQYRLYKPDFPAPCIVEGEIDALSVIQSGGNACALRSTTNIHQFVKQVSNYPPPKPLYLLLDNDENGSGQRAQEQLAAALQAARIPHYCGKLPDGYKDANELLTGDPERLRALVEVTRH